MPISGLSGAITFVIENKAYVGIGLYPEGNDNIFFEYDSKADTWTQKGYFPGTPRYDEIGFSIGNTGYLGLGSDGQDFYKFTPPFTTSINSTISNNEKEKIFPNPTTGRVTINTNYPVNNISILSSVLKEVIYFDNIEKTYSIGIDFSGLFSGIYFIEIKYKNGKTSTTKILFCC